MFKSTWYLPVPAVRVVGSTMPDVYPFWDLGLALSTPFTALRGTGMV